jgi:periplasmic protein TonB
MTVRQIPQPGDVVATRAQDRGNADNLHGVVLVARRDEPEQCAASDLSNVVPFARPRRAGAAGVFPLPAVSERDRSLPLAAKLGIAAGLACVAASLMLHGALLTTFWHQPKPMASIGIEVMTVEIVLGGTTAAGLAPTPGEQETVAVPPSEQPTQDQPVTEPSRAATVMSQEVPVASVETAPEARREEAPPETQTIEPQQPEQTPETAVTETTASTQLAERPPERTELPRPQVTAVQTAPERKRIAAPTDKKASQKKQRAAATPSTAASGIGRGRSDNSANYNGMVAAHLARYKQYPTSARSAGVQGTATVSFSIDGGGRVTSARLARGSGNAAIDQEVVAMARRASPFPAPPDRGGRNFTVPVRFNLR